MLPPLSIKLLEDHIGNLIKRMEALEKQSVFIGMDDSQGEHYSGFTNVELFAYHSTGDPSNNIPARPVMDVAFTFNPIKKSPLKKDLTKYLSQINKKNAPIKVEQVTENLGKFHRQKAFEVFGDSSKLRSNSDVTQALKAAAGVSPANKPLMWEGDLRQKIGYSVNGQKIKSIG